MTHIVIAVPAYVGTVHLSTVRSLFHDMTALMQRGDQVSLIDDLDSCYIDDTRASIVAHFLHGAGDVLVMIDHDVAWEANALLRLVDHPVDMCAGVYPKRKDPIEYLVRYLPDRPEIWADVATGLIEVEGAPGGFVKYTRAMLERMVLAHPQLDFASSRSPSGVLCGLFEAYRVGDGHKLGDDYAFCRRWRDIGGKVWVDPTITMSHVGPKAFVGNFGNWLKGRNQEDEAA